MTGDAAFSGLAGDVVGTLEPHTEADPTGLLVTFLAAFGAAVGPGPHSVADGSIHPARLNVVLVGRSARARKGTSWAVIRRVFEHADPAFCSGRVIGGLTSGEGLVADLADRPEGPQRHVLVMEPEFARLLRVSARSATLSALIRVAWDGGNLAILTRKQPLRATNASVAFVGHVTAEELRRASIRRKSPTAWRTASCSRSSSAASAFLTAGICLSTSWKRSESASETPSNMPDNLTL